jgi:hypothetical protein
VNHRRAGSSRPASLTYRHGIGVLSLFWSAGQGGKLQMPEENDLAGYLLTGQSGLE